MQYASGSRDHGLGRALKARGQEALGAYRFDRIERRWCRPSSACSRSSAQHRRRLVYLTVGSELPDYSDLLPHMRAFAESAGNTRGNHEHEILDALAPRPGEPVLNKTTMSAFHSTGFERLVRAWGVEQLLFTGISTNSCVEGTARDAADRGFRCVIVEDGCGAAPAGAARGDLRELRPPAGPGGGERGGAARAGARPACLIQVAQEVQGMKSSIADPNTSNALRSVAVAVPLAAILSFPVWLAPAHIEFKDFGATDVIQLLTILFVVALLAERALEVFVGTKRAKDTA